MQEGSDDEYEDEDAQLVIEDQYAEIDVEI